MNSKEMAKKILEETYILNGALEAQDLEMALASLSRREDLIDQFGSRDEKFLDTETKELIEKFETENIKCMALLEIFKDKMTHALYEVKAEKKKTVQKLKVHDSYSNPYAKGVGTSFDLKK